ncbi:MAG TPA: efflux RND transporter periplasmic adaptor subunit [Candidatus Binataceae bacterium]|nr:efflux RND transporter periplasmic adaptor subunit [Candidatus Binataceae bacterium]
MKRWLALLMMLLAACDHSAAPGVRPSDAASAPRAVEVVVAVSRRISVTEELPAELVPWEVVAIYPKVRGFVAEIPVDRGSIVHRGQLLVKLSAPELIAQTAEAEAALRSDRSTYGRLLDASNTKGAVSENEIEISQQIVAGDRERVRSLKSLADYLVITAPFDGIITERNVHPGALVGPPAEPLASAVPMLRIEQIAHLRLTVPVPEADAGAVSARAKVTFHVRAYPGREFSGTISRVSHWVDPSTRTMAVEADVYNNDHLLDPGMFAQVLWPIRRQTASVLVPASAVVETADGVFVEVVEAGRVKRISVQRGKASGEWVEVFGSLNAGDRVIMHGSEELVDGAHVICRERNATKNPG